MKYIYPISDTLNNKADSQSLKEEIQESDIITIAISSIAVSLENITIDFKASISAQEKSDLDSIVSEHEGEAIQESETLKTQQVLAQGGKRKTDRGFKFTAVAGQDTSYEHTFTESLFIKEGIMYTEGQDFFDQVTAEFVDKQYVQAGILYPSEPFLAGAPVPEGTPWSVVAPEGVALHKYIGNFPIDPSGKTHSVNEAMTELDLKDLTIKMTYHSVGASDVKVNVGIVAYS